MVNHIEYNEDIVRIFRKPRRGELRAQAVADILMTGPIHGSEQSFARRHGGDFIVCLSEEEADDQAFYYSLV